MATSETNLLRFSLVLYINFQLFGNKRKEQLDIHQVIDPPWTNIPGCAADSLGPAQSPPHGCWTFLLLLEQMGRCSLWVWRRRSNRWPCCLPMSNPSTSPRIARHDSSGWWDNWLAALHLPRDLVRPSSRLKELAQTMMMKQLVLAHCGHSLLKQPCCAVFMRWIN